MFQARFLFIVSLFLLNAQPVLADAGLELFEKKIRPVLVNQCYRCHSPEKRIRGGLDVSTRAGLLKGGDTGPALIPGKPEKSLLIKALSYSDDELQMPPRGKLEATVLADFQKWVKLGAPDPRTGGTNVAKGGIDWKAARQYWAFQPLKKPEVPTVKTLNWVRGPIDKFLLHQLEEQGFRPVGDVDRVTLIRRLYFTLIGLPPTPEKIQAFLNDESPKAVEKVVDELLSSPHFGERWGRHWLDVARFAESTGGGRSMLLKEAWRYRDYVVQSFNDDKPYNQFLMEQLAGDLLLAKDWKQEREQLTATAYLSLGPTNYELQDKSILEMDVIDEQLDVIGKGLLGLTIACARCHDHKFDPIPQSDYYALAGIFRSTKTPIHSNVSQWVERPLPLPPGEAKIIAARQKEISDLTKQIRQLKGNGKAKKGAKGTRLAISDVPGIVIDDTKANRVGTWNKSTFMNHFIGEGYLYDATNVKEKKSLTFTPTITKAGSYEIRLAYLAGSNRSTGSKIIIRHAKGEAEVTINQRKPAPIDNRFISLGTFELGTDGKSAVIVTNNGKSDGHVVADAVQFLDAKLVQTLKGKAPGKPKPKPNATENAPRLKMLEKKLADLKKKGADRPMAMSVDEGDNIADCPICIRGNIHSPGKLTPRGFLTIATPEKQVIPKGQSGRLQLAKWIAGSEHPLTARVMVNRIWHHVYGRGLVRTVDNFGVMGEKPSHPELLDYLAVTFIEEGWSMKQLIRQLVLTRAFQMSSEPGIKEQLAKDADNRLLWHANRRRLEAEVIRDAMLTVSGRLDRTIGGPTIRPGTGIEYGYKFDDNRRSIYTPVFRNVMHQLYEVFDIADPNLVTGKRTVSTTSTQALYLMNNPFVAEQAKQAALLTLKEKMSVEARLGQVYWKTLGRAPSEREQKLAMKFLDDSRDEIEGWTQMYHVLFASMDFRHVN